MTGVVIVVGLVIAVIGGAVAILGHTAQDQKRRNIGICLLGLGTILILVIAS